MLPGGTRGAAASDELVLVKIEFPAPGRDLAEGGQRPRRMAAALVGVNGILTPKRGIVSRPSASCPGLPGTVTLCPRALLPGCRRAGGGG